MHLSQILGFILINLLIISSQIANTYGDDTDVPNEDGDYDDDDEDYNGTYKKDQYLDETAIKSQPLPLLHVHNREVDATSSTPPPPILTSIKDTNAIHNNKLQLSLQTLAHGIVCPADCYCIQNSHLLLNCSNKQLTSVPKDIPKDVYSIDLSSNLITLLDMKTFYKLPQLYKIDLFNNSIENIHKEALQELPALKEIDLSKNELTRLDTRVFSGAPTLHQLWLTENPIKIPDSGSFLNIPTLTFLDLSSCNLSNSDLQEDMFSQLQHLKTLNLHDNEIEGDINTIIFKPMEELSNLRMPSISRDSLKELCDRLPAIDLINIEHEYSISCFYLSTGLSFEESKIIQTLSSGVGNKLADEQVDETSSDLFSNEINESDNEALNSNELPPKDEASLSDANDKTNELSSADDEVNIKRTREKLDNEQLQIDNQNTTNNETLQEDTGFNLADIPEEVIKYMLIGLFGFAMIGILVGLLCRRDVGGVKTKFCRRRKRPKNKSNGQTQPTPEEVPLNKITTSS